VGRRYSSIVEVSGDLAEGPSVLPLRSDLVDELRQERLLPSSLRRFRPRASRPPPFGYHSLELVDGDESRSPWHLDRLDQRQDATVERRAAHAERRGCLCARVRESFDADRFAGNLGPLRGGAGRRVPSVPLASASRAAARHAYSVHKC
jgi:hypothetical protein